jgi:hypothetical protein
MNKLPNYLFFLLILSTNISSFSQVDSSFFLSGQHAEIMLSGFGFNNSGGSSVFNHCSGIATDGTHLFLADRWNNRVLIWNSIPQSNIPPDLVLGQDNFNTNDPGTDLNKMNWPGSVSVSSNGKLVVADSYNNRVLVWNSIPTQNGQEADFAISSDISWPWGVWTNGQKLVVSSMEGAKIWNSFPPNSSQSADFTLTANGEFGTPRTITSNGDFLMIGDHNSKASNGPQGNFVWTAFPQSDVAYDYFTTDPYDKNYAWMQGTATDSSLIVLGKQLHIWNSLPTTSAQKPDVSLSYNFNGGDGSDLVIAGNKVFVSCMNDNRIFVFNNIPSSANTQPDFVLGSPDINTNTLVTNYFITNPVPLSDGEHLFVSSDFDRTLSVWNNLPDSSACPPDTVISLMESPWDNELKGDTLVLAGKKTIYIWKTLPLNGQQPDITIKDHIGSVYFNEIKGVAFDDQYFYVADENSIYVWKGFPTSSNYSDPDFSLNVTSPMRLQSDGKYFSLTEMEGNPRRALIYLVSTLSANASPYKIIEGNNQYQLNLPMHTIIFNESVFLANTIHNVIYAWKDINDAGDYSKVIVLGSDSAISTTPQIGDSTLFWPGALSFDGKYLWVGEFKFSGRIVRYTIPSQLSSIDDAEFLSENDEQNISVFPNPANDAIQISFSDNKIENINIALFDLSGKGIVFSYLSASDIYFIYIKKFPPGFYLLKFSTRNSVFSKKILINKD